MPTLSTAARNAACNAIVDLLDAGAAAASLVFRTSGDVEVATLPCSDPAFGNAATGVATASAITSDTSATGGTTTKATLQDSDANIVVTCTVGTSGNDINLNPLLVNASLPSIQTLNSESNLPTVDDVRMAVSV